MKGFLLYTGKRLVGSKIFYEYFVLDDINFDKNSEITDKHRRWSTSEKLWKSGIGAVHEVDFKDDDKSSIGYSKKSLPVVFWKNLKERAKWEAEEEPVEQYLSLKKEGIENKLEEILKPLKFLFDNCTRAQKRAIVARIIQSINE